MAYDIKKIKNNISNIISELFSLVIVFINIGLKIILLMGAFSAFMLLLLTFPEKALLISHPFWLLLRLVWNILKIITVALLFSTFLYIIVIYRELINKAIVNRRNKEEKWKNELVKDIAKQIKSNKNKK